MSEGDRVVEKGKGVKITMSGLKTQEGLVLDESLMKWRRGAAIKEWLGEV